jgi:uncharacterized membrane protein SirB2
MPYEFYKVAHLIMIFLFITGIAVSFFRVGEIPKWSKIVTGISSLLILVTGMGLIARLGISHGEPWPTWIITKVTIWLIVAVAGAVLAKRLSSGRGFAYFGILGLMMVAATFAVVKPF